MKKLKNNDRFPHTLDSGIVLAAADTPGSVVEVESLSEADERRLVRTNRVTILEDVNQQQTPPTQAQRDRVGKEKI